MPRVFCFSPVRLCQLRQEANHAGVSNRLLAEHDATIQELLGRLLERTAGQASGPAISFVFFC